LSVAPQFPHITTKLHVPTTRPNLVKRPRLNWRLNRCTQYKLLLISAPAGFGKTTLLSEWSQQSAWPVAWVSLDATDNDPMRFWSYVVAALDRLDASVGENVLPFIHSSRPAPVEYTIPTLINTVANIRDHFALVLDDYQCIESEAIHTALTYLLDYLPANMHLVLVSRTEPPLPLARWRARGQLLELRASDLRFSADETERLFNQVMALNLPAEDVTVLQERTQGWIAGLQLAVLATRQQPGHGAATSLRDFRGDHQYVVDYLASEVLQQQPEPIHTFLLQTAILDTLNGSLCDAVTGQTNGQAVLEQLHQSNLFVTALSHEGQYRHHQLFADFLRDQLQRDPSTDLAALHLRAADWYERHDDLDHAINHTLAAGHIAEAVQLIEKTARERMMCGEFATLLDWFKALPDPVIRDRPQFCLIYAWALANSGQVDEAAQYLDHLEDNLDDADGANILLGEAATVRARIAVIRGDTAQNIHFSRKSLDLLPPDALMRSDVFLDLAFAHSDTQDAELAEAAFTQAIDQSLSTGNLRAALMATYYLAGKLRDRGQFRQAVQRCQQGLAWCQQADPPLASACWAHAGFGALLYEWNELTTAIDHLRRAINLARQSGEIKVLMYAPVPLAHALQAQGQPDEALAVLDAAAEVAQQTCILELATRIDVARVRVWLRQGQLDTAAGWLQRHGLSAQNDALSPGEITMLAWFHLAQSQTTDLPPSDDLARIIESVEAQYETEAAHNWTYPQAQYLALLAMAYRALGDRDQAVNKLAEAISLAEPMGLVRTFVDHGTGMAALLRVVAARQPGSGYVAKLLGAFREPVPPVPSVVEGSLPKEPFLSSPKEPVLSPPKDYSVSHRAGDRLPSSASPLLVEPLRQREIEVLQHIAQGRSNKETADEMVVAVSTVKWYLRNIYDKLQVHRRTQAVAKARELDLL
jgi:LuxR family maltose regulon positive regulatory protein